MQDKIFVNAGIPGYGKFAAMSTSKPDFGGTW
jgi:hypothetical protein